MKKIVIGIVIALVVLVGLGALSIHLFLDGAVKRGVEKVGPKLTKVDVKLESVNLSLLSGSGKLKGLVVGNPEGYKSPSAINVGTATLTLKPRSVLSDKVIINSFTLEGPEITFETDLRGNNLSKILKNLEESTGGDGTQPAEPKEAQAGKKLQVDDFLIRGAKVHVQVAALGQSQSGTVTLPEIHLKDQGTGPEGITPAELSKNVLRVIIEHASKEAASAITDLTKDATGLTQGLGTTGTVEKANGLLDRFQKKKE
jgi:uncharacterized protein involved in outer membrane biogenesis